MNHAREATATEGFLAQARRLSCRQRHFRFQQRFRRRSSLVIAPELAPPVRVLMGPGPSDTHPRVLQALAKGTVGHLDPYYLEIMNGLQEMLRGLFRTKNSMTMAISGTGSAGMEATVVNLIEPGDSMIVCVNGVFGARMVDVAERAGAKVTKIEKPWGQVFTPDD